MSIWVNGSRASPTGCVKPFPMSVMPNNGWHHTIDPRRWQWFWRYLRVNLWLWQRMPHMLGRLYSKEVIKYSKNHKKGKFNSTKTTLNPQPRIQNWHLIGVIDYHAHRLSTFTKRWKKIICSFNIAMTTVSFSNLKSTSSILLYMWWCRKQIYLND